MLRCTVRLAGPGPWIARFVLRAGRALVKLIVPVTALPKGRGATTSAGFVTTKL